MRKCKSLASSSSLLSIKISKVRGYLYTNISLSFYPVLTSYIGFVVKTWSAIMGWSIEEIQIYAAHLRRELRSRTIHPYYIQKVVIGRKPDVGEVPP